MKALTALSAFAALVVFSAAASAAQGLVARADASAMKKLAQANMAEVEAGKLATTKAHSDDVKKFGQQMVDDHGKMLQDMQQLASSKGVQLPAQPSASERRDLKKLEGLSGDQFDKQYMSTMVKDHKKDVGETQKLMSKAKDADLKSVIEQANAKIKEHLQKAEQIAQSTGASEGSSK